MRRLISRYGHLLVLRNTLSLSLSLCESSPLLRRQRAQHRSGGKEGGSGEGGEGRSCRALTTRWLSVGEFHSFLTEPNTGCAVSINV